jgi:hypothetical protein
VAGIAPWVLLPRPAWAIRVLQTEDPDTVGSEKLELELGADYTRQAGNEGRVTGKLTVGAVSWLDLAYEGGFLASAPRGESAQAGLSDSVFMLKAGWAEEGVRPALGAVVNLRLPTGDAGRGLGENGVNVEVLGIVGKKVGPVSGTSSAFRIR